MLHIAAFEAKAGALISLWEIVTCTAYKRVYLPPGGQWTKREKALQGGFMLAHASSYSLPPSGEQAWPSGCVNSLQSAGRGSIPSCAFFSAHRGGLIARACLDLFGKNDTLNVPSPIHGIDSLLMSWEPLL